MSGATGVDSTTGPGSRTAGDTTPAPAESALVRARRFLGGLSPTSWHPASEAYKRGDVIMYTGKPGEEKKAHHPPISRSKALMPSSQPTTEASLALAQADAGAAGVAWMSPFQPIYAALGDWAMVLGVAALAVTFASALSKANRLYARGTEQVTWGRYHAAQPRRDLIKAGETLVQEHTVKKTAQEIKAFRQLANAAHSTSDRPARGAKSSAATTPVGGGAVNGTAVPYGAAPAADCREQFPTFPFPVDTSVRFFDAPGQFSGKDVPQLYPKSEWSFTIKNEDLAREEQALGAKRYLEAYVLLVERRPLDELPDDVPIVSPSQVETSSRTVRVQIHRQHNRIKVAGQRYDFVREAESGRYVITSMSTA